MPQKSRQHTQSSVAGVKLPMSVEDLESIDFVGIENNETVVLTISDHLEWSHEHLLQLQEKINVYLSFIESDEIYTSYPSAQGMVIKINVVCKHQLTEEALSLSLIHISEPPRPY